MAAISIVIPAFNNIASSVYEFDITDFEFDEFPGETEVRDFNICHISTAMNAIRRQKPVDIRPIEEIIEDFLDEDEPEEIDISEFDISEPEDIPIREFLEKPKIVNYAITKKSKPIEPELSIEEAIAMATPQPDTQIAIYQDPEYLGVDFVVTLADLPVIDEFTDAAIDEYLAEPEPEFVSQFPDEESLYGYTYTWDVVDFEPQIHYRYTVHNGEELVDVYNNETLFMTRFDFVRDIVFDFLGKFEGHEVLYKNKTEIQEVPLDYELTTLDNINIEEFEF